MQGIHGIGRRGRRLRASGFGSGFWYGVAEALLVPLAFVALGLSWWGAQAGPAAYPRAMDAEAGSELWLIDGFNVVQVALLAGRDRSTWWTSPHRAELARRAQSFAARHAPGAELWIVFDGERAAEEGDGPVRSLFAPSADAWVLARVRAASEPQRVRVVTADRRLAARVRRHGAQVVSPAEFLGGCGPDDATSEGSGGITTL